MSENRRVLETSQLLGAMPPETLEGLRAVSTSRTFARNEVIFHRDEAASEMYGIVSGRVAILTSSPDGRESLVAVLEEGALFGELGLFDDGPRSADARALEETKVIVLGYEPLRAAIDAAAHAAVGDRAPARPAPAHHRRRARRRGVPRRARPHREAPARHRRRARTPSASR